MQTASDAVTRAISVRSALPISDTDHRAPTGIRNRRRGRPAGEVGSAQGVRGSLLRPQVLPEPLRRALLLRHLPSAGPPSRKLAVTPAPVTANPAVTAFTAVTAVTDSGGADTAKPSMPIRISAFWENVASVVVRELQKPESEAVSVTRSDLETLAAVLRWFTEFGEFDVVMPEGFGARHLPGGTEGHLPTPAQRRHAGRPSEPEAKRLIEELRQHIKDLKREARERDPWDRGRSGRLTVSEDAASVHSPVLGTPAPARTSPHLSLKRLASGAVRLEGPAENTVPVVLRANPPSIVLRCSKIG